MKPNSTEFNDGRIAAIQDLLETAHLTGHLTLEDVEDFQRGQLLAQKDIKNINTANWKSYGQEMSLRRRK